jgi:hypothetical protein
MTHWSISWLVKDDTSIVKIHIVGNKQWLIINHLKFLCRAEPKFPVSGKANSN